MNEKIAFLLNQQINKEFYSAYLYLDMSNYYDDLDLDGFANYYLIQAQEERDHAMLELDKQYPQYLFAKHKGYGTKVHRELLLEHGPCAVHRRSFLKKILGDRAYE